MPSPQVTESSDETTPMILSNLEQKLQGIVPSDVRRPTVTDKGFRSATDTLKSSQQTKQLTPPRGWVRIKHPDIDAYYFHEEKVLYTWSNVLDTRVHDLVMKAAEVLHKSFPPQDRLDANLVLDMHSVNEGDRTCSYYYVSHGDRRIFWLEGMDTPSERSKPFCMEAEYWKHCDLFPTTFTVTKNATRDLKHILLQASADRLVVKFSTSPYDKDDLTYMFNLVKEIEEIEADVQQGSGHSSWVIAKFMSLYNDGVLRSSFGQSDDYFDIDSSETSVRGPYQRSYLMAFLAPFLLKSPDVYAEELHSFHDNFTPERWAKFVRKVDMSIRDSNLLATVLLGANLGVLSFNDSPTHGSPSSRSAVLAITYVSIIGSAGSIIIGLAIFKQYRAKGADTPLRAVTVLKRILNEKYGLDRIAIICSLPYVLLMWSLIAFLGTFVVLAYSGTDPEIRIPVSVALGLIFLSVFFCLYTAGPPDKENKKSQEQPNMKMTARKQDSLEV
ncbi:hypothetical protein PAXINDRAFT_167608 [Paxillus involutus ATCC 200175]|nr:hypothetical protein PAXINDRAFT_167608 [Paxillus involutus ATCC 200175]